MVLGIGADNMYLDTFYSGSVNTLISGPQHVE